MCLVGLLMESSRLFLQVSSSIFVWTIITWPIRLLEDVHIERPLHGLTSSVVILAILAPIPVFNDDSVEVANRIESSVHRIRPPGANVLKDRMYEDVDSVSMSRPENLGSTHPRVRVGCAWMSIPIPVWYLRIWISGVPNNPGIRGPEDSRR